MLSRADIFVTSVTETPVYLVSLAVMSEARTVLSCDGSALSPRSRLALPCSMAEDALVRRQTRASTARIA
jgi:hypothetical protein